MKTVIITGGNRGIGFEICRQLDAKGFKVILVSRDLEKGLQAAEAFSSRVIVKQCDVTQEESVINLFDFIKSEISHLDVLINNAGLGAVNREAYLGSNIKKGLHNTFPKIYQAAKKLSPLLKKTGIISTKEGAQYADLNHSKIIMETNFYGVWRMIQYAVPLLIKSKDARIINISSGMGELKSLTGLYPEYSLSKSSLNALTIMFSNELRASNIKVNAVCPGWVRTDMGGPDAPLSVEQGADTAVWLASANISISGKFFKERKEQDW